MKIAVFTADAVSEKEYYTAYSKYFPPRAVMWDDLARRYPEHTFHIYCTMPSSTVIDADWDTIYERPELVPITILPRGTGAQDFAARIAQDQPDRAMAFSVPSMPYDWVGLMNAVIGAELTKYGIEVFADPPETAAVSFDKWRTKRTLRNAGFHVPEGFSYSHNLYHAQEIVKGIEYNYYKEYIMHQARQLHYPVLVKQTACAGSVGIERFDTPEALQDFFDHDKGGINLFVEELVPGEMFGIEVYGSPGHYTAGPLVMFSNNEFGLTAPKVSPVHAPRYHTEALQKEIVRLAQTLQINGMAEIDLIFHEDKWYILEINGRYTLMTQISAAVMGTDAFNIQFNAVLDNLTYEKETYAVNFECAVVPDEMIEQLCADYPSVKSALRISYLWYQTAEFVVGGFETQEALLEEIDRIAADYPQIISGGMRQDIQKVVSRNR